MAEPYLPEAVGEQGAITIFKIAKIYIWYAITVLKYGHNKLEIETECLVLPLTQTVDKHNESLLLQLCWFKIFL